jgi:23S rRNA pseudouridine2605 synthase
LKSPSSSRFGVARVLSKRGLASRTEAAGWVREGRVRVDGRRTFDPEYPTHLDADIQVDGLRSQSADRIYLALNKPRGLVTTARDEKQRATIYDCLRGLQLPWVAPVGRLDQASEGLLLLSNDSQWAAGITAPESSLRKTYHVQIDRLPSPEDMQALSEGVEVEIGQPSWQVLAAHILRSGGKTAWLEIVLDEGRNRQIRRMLAVRNLSVLRLIRVAIGPVPLGTLVKGAVRALTAAEIAALTLPENRSIC